MKLLLIILCTASCGLFPLFANTTTYYVSSSTGNNGNAGTSSGTAWQTLSKINSSSFGPGDIILLKRGDTFIGPLIIPSSGSSGNPISFSTYGAGANPIISGFNTVAAWTNLGGNIWQSTSAVTTLSSINIVVENGTNTPMGRTPNSGWYNIDSHVAGTQITSSSLGAPNWSGAEVVVRKEHYIIDRSVISSQAGSTINYSTTSGYDARDNYGFFIQNDSRTLDQQGEWYFDPSTKKLKIYSTSMPVNVEVPAVNRLVEMINKNYLTFSNINFHGSGVETFYIGSCSNVQVLNCDFVFSGQNCIWGGSNFGSPSSNFRLEGCTINHTNGNAITLANEFVNPIIRSNVFTNTATIAGASVSGSQTSRVLFSYGVNGELIELNRIDSVGYIAIELSGTNSIVQKNFINNFCLNKDDGAGIYAYSDASTGKQILDNIVLNGIGDGSGTADGLAAASAIYMDDFVANTEVARNTGANCALSGLFLHNTHNMNVHNNTFYNNESVSAIQGGQLLIDGSSATTYANTINNNIFFSKTSVERTANVAIAGNPSGFSGWGTINNNYYARPIGSQISIHTFSNGYSIENDYTIAQWNSVSSQDGSSLNAPWTIASTAELRFEYNATNASVVVALGANYVDVYNTSYAGTITLPAYGSAVLKYVSALSGVPTDPPNPTSNSPQTTTVTLTRSGSPPAGVTWYWQFTCSTSTVVGAGTTYNATTSGTYYIRARDNTSGVWSAGCGSLAVVVTGGSVPSNPGNPTSNSPQAGSVTITRVGSPGGGETWYWQNTSCGTSTAFGSGTTFNATSTGTYYIRANNAYGWSAACGSVAVVVVAPGTTNTLFKWKGKLIISY